MCRADYLGLGNVSLTACSSPSRWEALRRFPHLCWHDNWCCHYVGLVYEAILWNFPIMRLSHGRSPGVWFLRSYCSLLTSSWTLCRGYTVGYQAGSLTLCFRTSCGSLQFPFAAKRSGTLTRLGRPDLGLSGSLLLLL